MQEICCCRVNDQKSFLALKIPFSESRNYFISDIFAKEFELELGDFFKLEAWSNYQGYSISCTSIN